MRRIGLETNYRAPGMDPVILDDQTIEERFGWVFFFQSKTWLDTQDPAYLLIGNAPIVVTRDGQIHMTGTGRDMDDLLERFRG